ncbi:ATP-binding protein [Candidatus Nephthysia bennettiae]|uniref:ATP-binding protein n=1 Tax=Candidatus Nephthysia bennettiae TaxID=3127016 RepID=A0A934K9M0_9BACT|nr:ATP-binding protein [Candidatus Dormibacteraeota bacterium]MBJ7614617.1 ATP-binding protein [Candidatus Dormibacteraeota bacterium]PZS35140.1 MAG: hypothetical protein DLM58_04415 [Pseudonocardiales bacterium]
MAAFSKPPRLVGRGSELAFLEAELALAATGLRCVLLVADPGVGKSRLAREMLDGNRRGGLIMTARGSAFGATTPFGLWSEAFESHLSRLAAPQLLELCSGLPAEIAGLLPSVSPMIDHGGTSSPSRLRLVQGLTRLLANLTRQGPVLIFLDDVHLADPSSWAALSYIARNLAEEPVLLLLAARPAELSEHQLGTETLLGLEQEGRLVRLL